MTDFGADPTGRADSTAAIQDAIDAAANASKAAPVSGIGGGRIGVLLEGGTYMVSAPLEVGSAVGVSIRDGTLVAAGEFPSTGYLLNGVKATQLSLETLTLDADGRGGCLRLDAALQVTVRDVQFLHFKSHGIFADDASGMGHELMVSACFFAEMDWGEPGYNDKAAKTGTAVEMRYPDSHILDSIMRCSRFGVVNHGGSNLFQALHIYTTCDHAASPANMTVGFWERGSQTRFLDGYMDNCAVQVQRTDTGLALQSTLFFGQADLVIAPDSHGQPVHGLLISSNQFTCTPYGCGALKYSTANGTVDVSDVAGTRIAGNWFANASHQTGTVARASAAYSADAGGNAVVRVPLAGGILFPPPAGASILQVAAHASATATVAAGSSATAVASLMEGGADDQVSVLVYARSNSSGTVFVEVDLSR